MSLPRSTHLSLNLPDHLSKRVVDDLDYTRYDALLESIVENFCRCPISLEITEEMVIFNQQCYDVDSFERIEVMSLEKHKKKLQRYPNHIRKIKDPRTKEVWNYEDGLGEHFRKLILPRQLGQFIHDRIPAVSIEDAITFYIPNPIGDKDEIIVKNVVAHIQHLIRQRETSCNLYKSYIDARAAASVNEGPIQNEVFRWQPNLDVAPHPNDLKGDGMRDYMDSSSSSSSSVVNNSRPNTTFLRV